MPYLFEIRYTASPDAGVPWSNLVDFEKDIIRECLFEDYLNTLDIEAVNLEHEPLRVTVQGKDGLSKFTNLVEKSLAKRGLKPFIGVERLK